MMTDLSFDQRWALRELRRATELAREAQNMLHEYQTLARDYGLTEQQIKEVNHG